MYIGPHLSISKGYKSTVKQAIDIGANTFQFFTRNPRGARARKLDMDDIKSAAWEDNNNSDCVLHVSIVYIVLHNTKIFNL